MASTPTLPADTRKLRNQLQQDQAPAAKVRTPMFDQAALMGMIGRPHSSRYLTINQMYEMREDAILAFAQLVEMIPILTGKWAIECRDGRKAAFLDNALRRIYGRLTLQFFMADDFGWQALCKQFGLLNPGWRYLNKDAPGGPKTEDVWDQNGVPALVWEPFVPLRPESVEPAWTVGGGFDGIKLRGSGFSLPGLITVTETVGGQEQTRQKIDLANSLWVINQRDTEFGSIWGRSKFRYAFKYWYAYEMTLSILNRSVERKGDPVVVVRYPQGSSMYGGKEMDNQDIAFLIGKMARSGSVLAIPSEAHEDDEGGKGVPKWKVEYLTSDEKFEKIESILSYLDTQKFRARMLPEQAVTEGRGGTSSRNVAEVMGTRSVEMQWAKQIEHDAIINQYMIPQLAEAHYPILSDEPARKVTQTFGDDEVALAADLLRSTANANPGDLPIDWAALLERFNIDTLSPEEIAAKRDQMAAQAETATKPPPQEAKPNGPAGVTDTGFYYDARERLEFADDMTLLASLPPTKHYQDNAVLAQTRLIRKIWFDLLGAQYESFAAHLERDDISLADVDLADGDSEKKRQEKIVDAIMKGWSFTGKTYQAAVKRTATALASVFDRAGKLELRRSSLTLDGWNPQEQELAKWIKDNAATMVRRVEATTQRQLRDFLLAQVKENKNAPEIADNVRKHFADFPAWRADLIARNEVRRFYNAATIFAARSNDRILQALDARLGVERSDPECIARNGRLFDPEAAFVEDEKEHPRGTLAWRIMPTGAKLSIEYVTAEESPELAARIDREENVIYMRDDLSVEMVGDYLVQIGDWLERTANINQ